MSAKRSTNASATFTPTTELHQGERTMYYIEGTIDALEISGANSERIRFSLTPASERILSRDGGKKMALFTESSSSVALLVEPDKNATGREVLWFHAEEHLCNILLSAKNNRNTVWVWCDNPEKPELDEQKPFPPISTIEAKGIRVF